jgi:outer membrane protein assembly factor BamB
MHTEKLIKRSIILVVIFLTFLGLIFPTAVALIERDSEDGVWLDNFDDDSGVILTNCIVDNGTIVLSKTTNEVTHDFTDDIDHKAYSYVTPYFWRFLPPRLHIFREHRLQDWTEEIDKIEDHDFDPYQYSTERGRGTFVVHHFRLKIDINPIYIDKLDIYWHGRAINDRKIELYYWKYFSGFKLPGFWNPVLDTQSQGSWETIAGGIPKENIVLSIDNNHYLDICIVAYPEVTPCTLFTDYIKIVYVTEEGFSLENGYAITFGVIDPKAISNTSSFYWDLLSWSDYEIGDAKVKYQICYNDDGNWTPVEEKYLKGNEEGFSVSPISLHSMPHVAPYDRIKIKANLSTDNHLFTPKISSWAVTWQQNTKAWQDLFNYGFRIEKSKVSVIDGNVSIDPIIGDWPMFGQNPQNTRSSLAEGPKDYRRNWWSQIGEEEDKVLNCVIMDGALYVTYLNSKEIYVINDISTTPAQGKSSINYDKKIDLSSYDRVLVNSPTITEDKIIIATGKESNQGINNYVIAINRNDDSIAWDYKYPSNICYSSTPVVYDDKVFVTSWSGDPDFLQSNANNKVIALELQGGTQVWEFNLPAKCISTPAIYDETIIVGCAKENGNSLFAINIETGESVWNQSVGVINRASPVVYNDKIYIISKCETLKKIKLTALNAENGTILWNKEICRSILAPADSTPAIFDDIIYIASPEGKIIAYDLNNIDNPMWETSVYYQGVLGSFLLSSPVYSNGIVYIGTHMGRFHALDAKDGDKLNGWGELVTFQIINGEITDIHPPIVSSPVVSSGLVFFGDNNGKLYSLGEFKEAEDQEIAGSLVSVPIDLPEGFWWDKFYANANTSKYNSIKYSILDENKNKIKDIKNDEKITMETITLERTIRLKADLYAENASVNPQLFYWRVTFLEDKVKPKINKSSFSPEPEGWINKIIPEFSVKVVDTTTGLLVSSAKYVLEYSRGNGVEKTKQIDADCTGTNGTKNVQTITANISSLDFYNNITDLYSINISIYDLAGNKASLYVELHLDQKKPTSYILEEDILESYNAQYDHIRIKGKSQDPGSPGKNSSGIKKTGLYYRFSQTEEFSGNWILFEEITDQTSPIWRFSAEKGGGFYELSTIAMDVAENEEDEKETGDVSFFFDPIMPTIPVFPTTLWFNTTPVFSVRFSDDYLLDTVEYRPNFETEWTVIQSGINKKTFDASWTLLTQYWDFMEEGEEYYLFFRVNDSVNNIFMTVDIDDALPIVKDISDPIVDLEIPDIEAEWTWEDTFKIKVYADDRNGSNIQRVELWYRYSENNENWSTWTIYEDEQTYAPFVDIEWEFTADEGNGYYEFYIKAEDAAGNAALSEVFSTGVNLLPLVYITAMISLIVVLVLIIIVLFFFWKIKKK